jgi:hypothetical protein
VSFEFSEPLWSSLDGRVLDRFDESAHAHELLSFSDASGSVPHRWETDSGGHFGILFSDRENIGGDVTLQVRPGLTDRAGNAAVMTTDTIAVKNVGGILESEQTFDDGPPSGLLGAARYVASGAPCETGGCIVLEGAAQKCSTQDDTPALWGVRVDYGNPLAPRALLVRYRVLSTSRVAPGVMVWADVGFESGEDSELPLEVSDGLYTHATGWNDAFLPPWSARDLTDHDSGRVIGIGCTNQAIAPQVMLVIDRVELVDQMML